MLFASAAFRSLLPGPELAAECLEPEFLEPGSAPHPSAAAAGGGGGGAGRPAGRLVQGDSGGGGGTT